MSDQVPITKLLAAAGNGDTAARQEVWRAIYDVLHKIAQNQMAAERPGRTLQPTALVHEAYFRLLGDSDVEWSSRRHFFGAAARAMRQIRIDDARRRKRLKRGGDRADVELSDVHPTFDPDPAQALAIDEALKKLEREDSRKAEIVMLRYFGGLTANETADTLGISRRTVLADWRVARVWLYRELSKGDTTHQLTLTDDHA